MFQREPTQFHNVLGVVECGWGGDRLGLHLATEEQDRSEVIEYKVYSWIKKNDLEIFDIMGKIKSEFSVIAGKSNVSEVKWG